jgi:hypothetical protein
MPCAARSNEAGNSGTSFFFCSLFVWLVAAGCCWFVLREKYWWLVWIEIDASVSSEWGKKESGEKRYDGVSVFM